MERDLVISSQLESMDQVRLFLDQIFMETALDRKFFNRVFLVLSELVYNSIVHGNSLDERKFVFIKISVSEYLLSIVVEDEGDGFTDSCVTDPTFVGNIRKEQGRGIWLIRKFADEVIYSGGGKKVRIIFNLS